MPRFLSPRHSTPHRVAVIALYRALLSRCTTAPLSDELRSSLRNAVQNKFRQNRKIQSAYQLGLAFRAGYETLDHLDAANNGDPESASFLKSYIPTLPKGITRSPPQRYVPPPPDPLKQALECLPPEKKVLNVRPHLKLTGPRHVPILASANGVPFLRLGKPQPRNLSRMLRQKLATAERHFGRKVMLENYWEPLAKQEDIWDAMIEKLDGVKEKVEKKTWAAAMVTARNEEQAKYNENQKRDREIAARMQEIVDKEMALAKKEVVKVMTGRKGKTRGGHRPLFP
ncbi:hypothetical protein BDV96DRAFT_261177 [Lophiotrema nucula]|uniref:Complex 1 LYR protein domain-containing protein n=1 Tax=Lophiotrema nucula TaxID=690887 RepID=A0A6A5YNI3_9PLEO|nr:hypothetical protein BDV96DRAFT_261177 [Lophiotrema nucula]